MIDSRPRRGFWLDARIGVMGKWRKMAMLTLEEILSDAAALPEFRRLDAVQVNSRGIGGETPLHWMATLGDVAAIKILASHGAIIDASDHDGNTPLHEAVSWRQVDAANTLLQLGANVFQKNKANLTPCDLARTSHFRPMEALFVHFPSGKPV
jgi:hypothetical protein